MHFIAKNTRGILGDISGKVGDRVYTRWRGIPVVRSTPGPRKKKPSPTQLAQQASFRLISKFLQPLNDLLAISFGEQCKGMTGANAAMQHNLKAAITGNYPDLAIDPARVLISQGSLPNVISPVAASVLRGKLVFCWGDNMGTVGTFPSDTAFVAAYCAAQHQWIYQITDTVRKAGVCVLNVEAFRGKFVETYIGFKSAGPVVRIADSVYTGMVRVLG